MASAFLTLTALGANAVADMMVDANEGAPKLRFIRRPSRVTFAMDGNAITVEVEVISGERTVVERSNIDGGGTQGVVPNLQQKAQSFFAAAGEELAFRVRETGNVGTTDIQLFIDVTPL